MIYTLLGSCRRHGVNPSDYLKDLFTRLPAARITQIREFTPAVWIKANALQRLRALRAEHRESHVGIYFLNCRLSLTF